MPVQIGCLVHLAPATDRTTCRAAALMRTDSILHGDSDLALAVGQGDRVPGVIGYVQVQRYLDNLSPKHIFDT